MPRREPARFAERSLGECAKVPWLPASANRARLLGYDGKWVIHPDQIAPCNELFTPPADQVERAERILEAVKGAARLDGEMVDEATRKLAEAILLRANAGKPM